MHKPKIIIETVVKADINKVWNCWTGPEHIMQWNQASDDWHCPAARNDLKKGGKFSFTMSSKDGKSSFDFEGIYDDVVYHKKIASALADGRHILVLFENLGNQTKVIERFDPENENPEELQRNGWQAILDNFKKYVETK